MDLEEDKKVVLFSCVLIKWKVAFKPKLTLRGHTAQQDSYVYRCRNRHGALQKVSDVLKEGAVCKAEV